MKGEAEQDVLKAVLNTAEGKRAAASVSSLSQSNIKDKINRVDRDEVIRKMQELGLGAMADKLRSTSNEEILNRLSANPKVLDKLKNLWK